MSPLPEEERTVFLMRKRERQRFGQPIKIGNKGVWLSHRIVLLHRDEVGVFPTQKCRDVFQILRECIVGCERKHKRSVSAQMRLDRHRH